MLYLDIKAFLLPALLLCIWIFIYEEGGGGCPRRVSGRTSLPTPRVSPPPPSQIHAATSATMRPLPARGPAALSRPAPRKCHRGPGSCSGGAQPPRPLQTWPCSTTSLRGLQQQPSPISRGVGDIKAQEQREQLASEWHLWSANAIIWKYITKKKNAASGGKAGGAPPLSKWLEQRETPGEASATACPSRAPRARPGRTLLLVQPAGSSRGRETNEPSSAELFRLPSLSNKTLMRLLWKCFILLILMPSRRERHFPLGTQR